MFLGGERGGGGGFASFFFCCMSLFFGRRVFRIVTRKEANKRPNERGRRPPSAKDKERYGSRDGCMCSSLGGRRN